MGESNVVATLVGVGFLIAILALFIGCIVMVYISHKKAKELAIEAKEQEYESELKEFESLDSDDRKIMLQEYLSGVRRARTLVGWSYLGIFFPLLGWILVGMGLSVIKSVPHIGSASLERSVKRVQKSARTSIFLSILVALLWGIVTAVSSSHPAQSTTAPSDINSSDQTSTALVYTKLSDFGSYSDWAQKELNAGLSMCEIQNALAKTDQNVPYVANCN